MPLMGGLGLAGGGVEVGAGAGDSVVGDEAGGLANVVPNPRSQICQLRCRGIGKGR